MALIEQAVLDQLSIDRMVFHIITDHETAPEYLPALRPVAFNQFEAFFLSLIHAANRGSRFRFSEGAATRSDLERLETGAPQTFLAASRRLADQFRLAHTGATSPGVILFFRLKSDDRTYSAIIKHDYQEVLAFRRRDGEVTLRRIQENIVRSQDAMQKCAVVDLLAGEHGELVADDLSGRSRRFKITNYFRSFLGVDPVHDDTKLSTVVHDFLVHTIERHRGDLPDDVFRHRRRRAYDAIDSQDCLDMASLESVVLQATGHVEDDARERILTTFQQKMRREHLNDERIVLTTSGLRKPRKRRAMTAEGVQILYDEEHANLIERSRTRTGERIVIETSRITAWDEDDPSERSTTSGANGGE